MAELSTDRENRIEIEHILAARDILRQMLDELLNLGGKNGRLHLRICTSGHAIQQRLHMLAGLTEILKVAPREDDLIRRAKRLAFQVADELERLAAEANHEFEWISDQE